MNAQVKKSYIAKGFEYDHNTKAHTKPVSVPFANYMDAIKWCNLTSGCIDRRHIEIVEKQ